ncbi:MAG: hypothetical protein RMM51_01145 [Verrucomicrobiae bacterium]|nr:hypothetical protein [Verrucomicrobiae bacterium]
MSEVVFNLGALALAGLVARWIALRGLFFALMTSGGLLLATLVTLRFWSPACEVIAGIVPVSEPVIHLIAFLTLLTLSLQPLLIAAHRLPDKSYPEYPRPLEVAGRIVFGTTSGALILCLVATTFALMRPVGLSQYDPSRWWWPADTAIVRVYQQLESFIAPHANPTLLPALATTPDSLPPDATTPNSS